MPELPQFMISDWAFCRTFSGRIAGPAAKLNTRSSWALGWALGWVVGAAEQVILEMGFRILMLIGRKWVWVWVWVCVWLKWVLRRRFVCAEEVAAMAMLSRKLQWREERENL